MDHSARQNAVRDAELSSSDVQVAARHVRTSLDGGAADDEAVQPRADTELDDRRRQLAELLARIGDAVRADGGELHLVDACYDTGVISVQLSGACSACAVASVTLEAGIERILRQRLDWVTDIQHSVADSRDVAADASLGRGGFVPRIT